MNIENFIGVGKEHAVTRPELCARLNLPDRQVRRLIAEARNRGVPIINDSDGAGSYMTDDVRELRRQYATNHSRARRILRQQKYIRRSIAKAENKGQQSLFRGE